MCTCHHHITTITTIVMLYLLSNYYLIDSFVRMTISIKKITFDMKLCIPMVLFLFSFLHIKILSNRYTYE
jgi:hypothetical protein